MKTFLAILLLTGAAAAAPDPTPAPEEGVKGAIQVTLPAIPAFELPPVVGGVHGARELRVNGKPLLGQDLKVAGYITWIYDCATAVQRAGETRAQAQTRADADPTLCQRPRFYVAEARDTPVESGLWVVEVPRAPNKLERERLPKDQLAKWPPAPKLAVGDYVVVSGKFAQTAPHGDRNSDGLVVFASVAKVDPSAVLTAVTAHEHEHPALSPVKPRAKKATNVKTQNESADHLNAANKLVSGGKLDEAVAEYDKATAAWPDNHLAWYGLGLVHAARSAWDKAAPAFDEAAAIRPDAAMYQMYRGIVAYELEAQHADTASYDKAVEYLSRAVATAPRLWRAHYYLGKIARAESEPRNAAVHFTKAIEANPTEGGPYIALAELYRKWDDADRAIAVAELGTVNAPKTTDLWYVLGMAYARKPNVDKAIAAFTKSLEAPKPPVTAVYERGRMEFAKKDFGGARLDLEAYVKTGDKNNPFQIEVANQLLGQIAPKH